jgi:predicted nucleotidyltransferase component of viral defense system
MADLFKEMLSRYEKQTKDDELNAIHEVMQQITLAGLYRGGFFNNAAFYGGTCLRIFHNLSRFSEDMDFSLLIKDPEFRLEAYFDSILLEFQSLGRNITIERKQKLPGNQIESAFLKDNTDIYNIKFQTARTIKIKIEVDKDPPLLFETENKLLLHPFSFMTRCYTLPNLFAGKIHALLFRKWRNRVKGRDWYDFEWYIRNNIAVDLNHFIERTTQSELIDKESITESSLKEMIKNTIQKTDLGQVKNDVLPFLKNPKELEIWSAEYFIQLTDMIRFR